MRRLDYVIRYVGNLERSIAFYGDVLGLPLKLRGDGYAEFATEGVRFALFDRAGLRDLLGPRGEREAGGPDGEVAFVVEDVDRWAGRLRDAGVEILSGPVDRPWGHRTLHLADPDGLVVELAEEIPRAGR